MSQILIHDDNYTDFIDPVVNGEVKICASLPRKVPFGALPFAREAALTRLPLSEIKDRAAQLKRDKMRISDRIREAGLKPLDQNGTNFCWANGPVNTVRVALMMANQPPVDLSPASVACQINGFRNQGGWGTEAMKWIAEHGVVPAAKWPANAINRQYLTEAAKAEAMNFRITEWDDLPARDLELLWTYLVNGFPVAIGLNWWRHEVTACDYDPDDGTTLIWNSWGPDWGDDGFGKLSESRARPDDACAPRVPMAQ